MSDEASKPIVAEAFLAGLIDCGIDIIFANSGTDFAPVIEAYASMARRGKTVPRFVTVPHENVAMSMANGYASITNKPAAVMVHVNVGTANSICGLMNASRDNVPILLMAGRTPVTESGNLGSRDNLVQWAQENFDQGAMVREHVKWDYELRSGQPVGPLIARALNIATSEPKGPVYLSLPREVLAEPAVDRKGASGRIVDTKPSRPAGETVDAAAELIAAAKSPLIIAGRSGRTAAGFASLSQLAERFALPVCQVANPNLPSRHPMNLGAISGSLLAGADLIIILDAPVPWIPRFMRPRDNIKVIAIGADPLFARYPFRGFPTDVALTGDPAASLDLLSDKLRTMEYGNDEAAALRHTRIAEMQREIKRKNEEMLETARRMRPIHPAWLAYAINQAKPTDAIIVNEIGVAADALDFTEAGSYLSGSAGGLGLALGQALGAKLAAPQRTVITVLGDGSYLLGVPLSAHFVAQAEKIATLTIIANNEMWYAVRRATLALYPDGEAAKSNALPLIDLKPSPAYEKVIEAYGGYGERVEDPADLVAAIERGLRRVSEGTPVLLNVICRPRGA